LALSKGVRPSGARFAGQPQAHQAAPRRRLGGVDKAAPVVQCRVVVGEEDVARIESELDVVRGRTDALLRR
jgi:hypothetical protein